MRYLLIPGCAPNNSLCGLQECRLRGMTLIEIEQENIETEAGKCIFCQIASGSAPADIIAQDEISMAFMDIRPAAVGHSLVITRRHFRNIFDIDDSSLESVMRMTRRIALATKNALGCDGMNIMLSNEKAGFQDIFHIHFHVIPRWFEDGYFMIWHRKHGDTDIMRKTAARIRQELKRGI